MPSIVESDKVVDINHKIGHRIRCGRISMGYTQEQLAKTLGISYQQVQKYETGMNRISAGRLFCISEYLGIDISYFFSDIDSDRDIDALSTQVVSTRYMLDMVRGFSQITDVNICTNLVALVRSIGQSES